MHQTYCDKQCIQKFRGIDKLKVHLLRRYLKKVRNRTRWRGGPKIDEIEHTYFLNGPLGYFHFLVCFHVL